MRSLFFFQFKYTQLALTQETDSGAYSQLFAYPPHESFFIEPREAVGAVRCRVSVADSQRRELVSTLVVPFSPRRGLWCALYLHGMHVAVAVVEFLSPLSIYM